ncbi:MAG: long-chain-acyl-CoA synthetase [Pseudomonadales bacterium]|nr:long-chain-acyl-CoA synthetase [Pseudomonadales bacterium]
MSEDVIRPIDLVKGFPNLVARGPAIVKAAVALSNKKEMDSMGLCVERTVKRYPKRPAIYYEDRMLTYIEFNEEANRVAHFLVDKGINRGDVVALLMHNRPEYLIMFTAIAKVGACVALLINTQTGKVLAHGINLVSPVMAIVGSELAETFNEIRNDLAIADDAIYGVSDTNTQLKPGTVPKKYLNLIKLSGQYPTNNLSRTQTITRADHLCYVYTSGTTGFPKAAIMDQNRYCTANAGINVAMQLNCKDIYYVPLPLYHATGLIACWGSVISAGASIVIRRRFSASAFWDDIDKYQATIFGYVGELCRYLLNQPSKPTDGKHTLKKMFGNGLRPGIWQEFKTRFKVPVILEFYGASEGNTGFANLFNLDNTIGVGSATLVKYDREKDEVVRDAEGHLVKVEGREPGLLIGPITDATPFVGYTQKDKTESAILRDVFKEGDAWFNTGDLLRHIGCKHYQFVDRLGDTFRWKGENVSTTQVENVLGSHPDIADCVVYGVEIPETNGKAGMATITPLDGKTLNYSQLHGFITKELPAYAIPLFFRIKNDVDTTGTFKYKKADLKKEAYNVGACDEPILVNLPKTDTYVPLTAELQTEIDTGVYQF